MKNVAVGQKPFVNCKVKIFTKAKAVPVKEPLLLCLSANVFGEFCDFEKSFESDAVEGMSLKIV